MRLRTSLRKNQGGVHLAMHKHYGAVGAKHYFVPRCAIIVAIMSQQGRLSNHSPYITSLETKFKNAINVLFLPPSSDGGLH